MGKKVLSKEETRELALKDLIEELELPRVQLEATVVGLLTHVYGKDTDKILKYLHNLSKVNKSMGRGYSTGNPGELI